MAELKTKQNTKSVKQFIDSVDDEQKRKDSYILIKMMREITGAEPKMWGPSIVGFGNYHYKYESGHEGDMCIAGFSPRKANLTLYILPGFEKYKSLMQKLGKYKTGKVCLYIKTLNDIDLKVLRELIEIGVEYISKKYKTKA
jgi:hypothetical protein